MPNSTLELRRGRAIMRLSRRNDRGWLSANEMARLAIGVVILAMGGGLLTLGQENSFAAGSNSSDDPGTGTASSEAPDRTLPETTVEPPAVTAPSADIELTKFPILVGELTAEVGFGDSYIPPIKGESFQLDLKSIGDLKLLQFGKAGGYVSLPGKIVVESVNYRDNGEFNTMRLVAVSAFDAKTRLVIDIRSYPAIPGPQPNLCWVWIVIEHDGATSFAAQVECRSLGQFPTTPK